ncbi:hypothetical protein A2U01_0068420, partial [Trifolium medium]|nr:hypothetical protein [Trifolium medium]
MERIERGDNNERKCVVTDNMRGDGGKWHLEGQIFDD